MESPEKGFDLALASSLPSLSLFVRMLVCLSIYLYIVYIYKDIHAEKEICVCWYLNPEP